MVNAPEFKYDYNTVKEISIYQFNQSVHQIINRVEWQNRMYGVYAGTVDAKRLTEDEMSWIPKT